MSDLRDFEVAKFIHRMKSKRTSEVFDPLFQATEEIHQYRTRQATQLKYYNERLKLETTKKSIGYTGRFVWNSLPLKIRNLPYHSFKKQLLKLTLEKYSK